MAGTLEEGEIEDGELPEAWDEEQESGEASGYSGPGTDTYKAWPSSSYGFYARYLGQSGPVDSSQARGVGRDGKDRERDRFRENRDRSRGEDKGALERAREDREREDLLSSLKELTRYTSVQDAMRSLDTVCKDLKSAIKKLDKLARKCKKNKQDDIEEYPDCFASAKRIFEGLRNIHIVSGTGIGKTQNLDSARQLMKTAMNYRHEVFTGPQKKELEGWVKNSSVFKPILDEKERSRDVSNDKDGGDSEKVSDQEQTNVEQAQPSPTSEKDATPASLSPSNEPTMQQPSMPAMEGVEQVEVEPAERVTKRLRTEPRSADNNFHQYSPPPESPVSADENSEVGQQASLQGKGSASLEGRQRTALVQRSADANASHPGSADTGPTAVVCPPDMPVSDDIRYLLNRRKLCLVLDLDHTLLNSAKFAEVDPEMELILQQRANIEDSIGYTDSRRELYCLPRLAMWTKLRPGVREFLRRAGDLFELWIHTNGNRAYAHAMVSLLDPDQEYFGNRIIAQGYAGQDESAAAQTKRLMSGLEGREPIAVILDDSSAVWPNDKRNLFVVERYIYFPASRRRFGMQGSALLEINRDECPDRGMLLTASGILERVHMLVLQTLQSAGGAQLAAEQDGIANWDVRRILTEERRKVLADIHIVFSRVIPLEQDPQTHPLWKLAEQFGAACSTTCNEHTTHVVAVVRGTEKVFWAVQNGRFVVTPAWLECSCILWKRANEDRFAVPA